jgi:non-heme chloroperoxidase
MAEAIQSLRRTGETSWAVLSRDDDQIVPIGASAQASSQLVKNATLKVYPGGPHGLADTHKDQLNADLLDFLRQSV